MSRSRRLPPICVAAAVVSALCGRLRFRRRYVGTVFVMEDMRTFRVFRHLSTRPRRAAADRPAILVVRFRFARLSQRWNRLLSLLPVPVIGGFPGFHQKLWMADDHGWWQGVYEWESARALEAYRASAVFRTMKRRAAPGTLSTTVIESRRLDEWLSETDGATPGHPDDRRA